MTRIRVCPGEILREEFLVPLKLPASRLAAAIGVSRQTVYEILRGERKTTAHMAIRLGRYFRTTPELWMNLQAEYEWREAREQLADRLEQIEECDLLTV